MTLAARIAAIAALIVAVGAAACEGAGPRFRVRYGLGGRWWSGPCPVSIEVVLESGRLDGTLAWKRDGSRWAARYTMPLRLAGPARKVFRFLHPDVVATPRPPLELDGKPVEDAVGESGVGGLVSTRHLVGVVGDALPYVSAEAAEAADGTGIALALALIAPHELPDSQLAFGPMRILVLRGRAPAGLDAGQARAVTGWVRAGGYLIISPGDPPASLRDAAWLAALTAGAPALAAEAGERGATWRRGRGTVEVLGFDETAAGEAGALRAFILKRMTSFDLVARPLFGDPLEMELMRLAQGSWAAQHDPFVAAALLLWGLLVLAALRPASFRGRFARHPGARVAFWPGLALVACAAIATRRPGDAGLRSEAYACIEAGTESDIATGEAIVAVRGTAGRVVRVTLPAAHAQPLARADRRGGLRFFYASPGTYDVEVGDQLALDGLRLMDSLPSLFDTSVIVETGGTWTARLQARDRDALDGTLTNGTRLALEAGYLIAEGAIGALPRVEPGATVRGPFRVQHPQVAPPPADAGATADALAALVRRYVRSQSFPADGLLAVPQISLMVVGRVAVPPEAFVNGGARATTFAAFWLPAQSRAVVGR